MRKLSKTLVVLVVSLLVLSLAACSTTTAPTAAPTTAPTSAPASAVATTEASASAAAATEAASTLNHDPITITAAIFMEPIETATIKTDPVSKYIQDKFGITLNIINNCIGSSWTDANPALIASNDLPDLFYTQTTMAGGVNAMLKSLVSADEVVALDDLVDKYCPSVKNDPYMQSSVSYIKTFFSPDGKLYMFPEGVGVGENPRGPVMTNSIRWDAYKKAGYPAITDYSSLADALKKMQDVAPAGVGGKKAYGISGWFADGQGWGDWELINGAGMWVQGANGVAQQFYGKQELEKTSDLVDVAGPFWQVLKFYNKCQNTGILDPNAFTMKWDDWNKAVEDGTVLYCSAGWIPTQKNPIMEKNIGSDADFVSLPPLDQYGDNFLYKSWGYGAGTGSAGYCIAKTCKYPERVAELMDWHCSEAGSLILSNGPEGGAWTTQNGVPTGIADYLKLGEFDTGAYKQYGANLYHHFNGYTYATVLQKTGVATNLRLDKAAVVATLTPSMKDALSHFGATYFSDPTYFGKVKNNTFTYPLLASFPALPDDLQTANANIANFVYQAEFKAVQAKTDAEFQAVFQTVVDYYNANGGPDILKWYLDNESAVKAKLDPVAAPMVAAFSK